MATKVKSSDFPSAATKQQSSSVWLKEHGLTAVGLLLDQVLPKLGFRQCEGTIPGGEKVASAYNTGFFMQHPNSKGVVYNISASYSQINSYENKLEEKICLLTNRIKWLNTGSCLLFGPIINDRVCIIVDCKEDGSKECNQFIGGVSSLLNEQVSHISAFNILRCTNGLEKFSNDLVGVTSKTIIQACDWMKECYQDHSTSLSNPTPSNDVPSDTSNGLIDAVVQASAMENVDSIVLIAFGSRAILSYSELKEIISSLSIPLNVSACFINDEQSVTDYEEIAEITHGKFHLYNPPGSVSPLSLSRPTSSRPSSSRPSSGLSSTSSKSTEPTKSLPNKEVILVWRELEQSRNTLADLQAIQLEKGMLNPTKGYTPLSQYADHCVSSVKWLSMNGLIGNQLLYKDLVSSLAFQHCEGVVKIYKSPTHSPLCHQNSDIEIVCEDKQISAQYCRGFVHLRWSDGKIIHIHLDKRPYEKYKQNVQKYIQKYNQRMQWLCKGSRELFGTVLEQNVIVILDTSSSMVEHLPLVKRKLRQLALEQLIHKARFSIIQFGTNVISWRDNLVPVTTDAITSMVDWVMLLEAEGSTNTLEALKKAVSTTGVDAIYLLTDGRPDQPFETIIQHLQQWQKVKVHTVSFNCADSKANRFLSNVANMTGGRYHYYSENLSDPDGPVTHRSEDLQLLEEEINLANEQLIKAEQLYTECSRLQQLGKNVRKTSDTAGLVKRNSIDRINKRKITSLSKWIQANSLLSRNLTLIDALDPSSVPHDPIHIDILDKDVTGRVFEEILTKAHVTGDGHIQLINPNGIDIRGYQTKLSLYIKECKEAIMEYGARQLPNNMTRDLKTEVGINVDNSLQYDSHLDALCDKLKEGNCYKVIEEIEQVKHEIMEAKQYSNQAESLLEEAKKKQQQSLLLDSTDGLQSPSYTSTMSSGSSVSAKTDNSDTIKSTDSKNECIERKVNNYSMQHGQRVACLHPEDNLYYPGIFVSPSTSNGRHCVVKLVHQQRVEVLASNLVPYGGATSCTKLSYGDPVLTRVRINGRKDIFMPGVICSIPGNPRVSSARYDVTLFGGRNVFCSRSALIKIGLLRYRQICQVMSDKTCLCSDGVKDEPAAIVSSLNRIASRKENQPVPIPVPVSTPVPVSVPVPVPPSTIARTSSTDESSNANIEAGSQLSSTPTVFKSSLSYSSFYDDKQDQSEVPADPAIKDDNVEEESDDGEMRPIHVTIDRGTSPEPLMFNIGTCTDPIMVDTSTSTLPATNEVATSTSDCLLVLKEEEMISEEESLKGKQNESMKNESFERVGDDISTDKQSNDLTIGMLTTPTHSSTPLPIDKTLSSTRNPHIKEQVLACWSDDGWYYKGNIICCNEVDNLELAKWTIADANNLAETFKRDDFITGRLDDGDQIIGINNFVIALHPTYPHSYAPGIVKGITNDEFHIIVQLYDTTETTLPRHEVYPVSKEKHDKSVKFIIEREQEWVGQIVIARSSRTGLFHPGTVIEHLKNSQKYKIKWANSTMTTKNAGDIFGQLTRRRPLHVDDYVIALPLNDPYQRQGVCYPGRLMNLMEDGHVLVQLYNNESCVTTFEQCFWISDTYYIDIINRIKQ